MLDKAWIPLAVIAAIGGAFVLWVVMTINRFVSLGNLIEESWSNVDVVLKRRHNLIPNLVEVVKGYATHERETLDQVIAARDAAATSTGNVQDQSNGENRLVRHLNQLLALVENYPDLKASRGFQSLQRELVNTEDRIAAARRFFNANVREFNTLLEQFPSMFVARMMGKVARDYFEVDELSIRQVPSVAL